MSNEAATRQDVPVSGPPSLLSEVFSKGSRWINELGSVMNIASVDQSGNFSGTYGSSVGKPEPPPPFPLNGRYEVGGNTLGWAVSYYGGEFHSTAAWSGQIQQTDEGPVIYTTWVLTRSTEAAANWNSTNVGFDKFKLLRVL
ncbi:hypothetical protein EMCRGX_G014733 [Ephydatia muelleri]|eukprot:Em0005g1250a